MNPKFLPHIALFLVALFYGGNYSVAKLVMDPGYIGANGFIVMRLAFGCLVFWTIHTLFVREKLQRADFGRVFLCGLLGATINLLFFFNGLERTTPINAALLMTTVPILVLICSSILLKERITKKKLLGIAIGATGAVLLILYGNKFAYQSTTLLGDLMVFFNAVSYGFYLVVVKRLMERYNPLTIVKWIFLVGLLFCLPIGWADLRVVSWNSIPTNIWFAVAYVLVLATVGTYLLNLFALSKVNASVVSIYIYLQPLLAAIISIALQQETLDWSKATAAACIFIGVYLVSSPNPQRPSHTLRENK